MNEDPEEPSDDAQSPGEYPPSWMAERLPIPKLFHSVEKDGPFTQCLQCNRPLIGSGQQYVIEKVFRGTEAIIEIAMCLDCRDESGDSMSSESTEAMQTFFEARANFESRLFDLSQGSDEDSVDRWVDRCLFTGQPRDALREYQVVALCQDEQIVRDFFPIMISGAVMEEISEVLSEQTKGWMDDFMDTHFRMPPEFCEPPGFRPVLI